MQPTHLDLFSGIGGFSLAFESVGFKTIGFSEIDPYASAVLRKHWPNVTNYGDVRTVPTIPCDVITGGFPCQPFSVAGKRRGATDDRFLWPAMLDVITRCKPAWVLGENVPGIIGMELDRVLADLEGIGLRAQSFVVPACAVRGMHRRDRVWVLAYSASNRLQGKLRQDCKITARPSKAFLACSIPSRKEQLPTPFTVRSYQQMTNFPLTSEKTAEWTSHRDTGTVSGEP